MASDSLSDLQIRFCHEYLKDLNATRAYMRAGYKVSSVDSAVAAASRLLRNVKVQAYLSEVAGLSEIAIVSEIIKIAFAKITDVAEFSENGIKLKDSVKLGDRVNSTIKSVSVSETEFQGKRTVITSVVLHDKLSALEKLMRKYRLYPKEMPLLEAVQVLLTEGVATPRQAEIIANGITEIEQKLKAILPKQEE